MNRILFAKWIAGSVLLLCSLCKGNSLYTAQTKLIGNKWERESTCTFNVPIQDTTQAYDVYLIVQYMPDFPYQNLHITYQLKDEQGNLMRTALSHHLLFDSKTGHPLGKGWGKKKCLRVPLITNYHFETPGKYSLTFVQFMRTAQLPGVASIGIQLYKQASKTD